MAPRPRAEFDPRVEKLAREAVERIRRQMKTHAPRLCAGTWKWMRSLAGDSHPARYYTARWDYPILLLPCWLDRRLARTRERRFRADIVYSTINGYYCLRLFDNLMDGETSVERELLPAAAFFHTEFQTAYFRYFAPDDAFWPIFRKHWFETSEAARRDAQLPSLGLAAFRRVAARKTAAAKIPIAAVCYRHGRQDLWPAWDDFSDRMARFIQMSDDLFDWHRDLVRARGTTFFLSEAERRRAPDETVAGWIVNGGFRWGLHLAMKWLADLQRRASNLECPEVLALLTERQQLLERRGDRMASMLQSLLPIAVALEETPPGSRRRARRPARGRP